MIYARGRAGTRNVPVPKTERGRFCIADDEVLELAGHAIRIEDHYSADAGHPVPMDIEWAKDGMMAASTSSRPGRRRWRRARCQRPLRPTRSREAGPCRHGTRGRGKNRRGHHAGHHWRWPAGRVQAGRNSRRRYHQSRLGADHEDAGAIVTERGGRTCHAAIVAANWAYRPIVGAAGR